MRAELCSRPEIVTKYSCLVILEFCDELLRWSSISESLEELRLLEKMPGSKACNSEKEGLLRDITLAFRDILARTCHEAYLTIGKRPSWKSCIRCSCVRSLIF